MSIESKHDCKYPPNFLWRWFASRLKAGNKCLRWNYWQMEWEVVEVLEQEAKSNQTVIINSSNNAFDFESYHRIRPYWYRHIVKIKKLIFFWKRL